VSASLKELIEEVKEYLRNEGFTVYSGALDCDAQSLWEKPTDWKGFLAIAKSQGISLIILEEETLTPADVEFDPLGNVEELLEERFGQIRALNLAWGKEGIAYRLRLEAQWWRNIQAQQNQAFLHVLEKQPEMTEKAIDSYVSDIVQWASDESMRKVTQAQVKLYLARKEPPPPYEVLREVWRRVNQELRARGNG